MLAASIRRSLIRWYEAAKRDLPWRRTRDPYAIWISEIMLQQTRVSVVIPYYERFLAAFPDAAALASAPEEQVLALWSGLGYYSRARNLQKAAIAIGTAFPREYDAIRELSGVGTYTAAAVASIAFGLPHAAVDGNIRRVIVRLLGKDTADVQKHAGALLDPADPGRWNQALMELGATVCLPKNPLCDACPLAAQCEARRKGLQNVLPSKRVKPEPERLSRTLLLIRRGERLLAVPSARVKGFWDLPEPWDGVKPGAILGEVRHTITHRHYRFVVRTASVKSPPSGSKWLREDETSLLSTIAKKALRVADSRR